MRAEVELFANRSSPVHDWDARWKIAALSAGIAVLSSLQSPAAGLAGVAGALGLLWSGRLPVPFLLARLGVAQAFLLPCLVLLPLTFSSQPFSLGPLTLSGEGLRVAAMMYLRALAILAVAMAVVYSTPMMVLLRALQCLLVPKTLVSIALLAYRYLFTLSWEFMRLRWALATRGFGNRSARAGHRILANVVGISLLRSFERTERIQQAMYCRGYTGQLHTLHRFDGRRSDIAKSIACVLLAGALLAWDRGWIRW